MRIPAVGLLALTILHTVSTITSRAASAQEERATVGAILALDAAVQKRFERVDRRFGLSRLLLPRGAHGFAPENDAELSSLHELEGANVRVVLSLERAGTASQSSQRHVLEMSQVERRQRTLGCDVRPWYRRRARSCLLRLPGSRKRQNNRFAVLILESCQPNRSSHIRVA
jgi:hypothetical protein